MKRLCLILAYLFLFTQTASAMPLLVGQKVVYRGTITGLRISAVDGTAFIDNAGATIPTYADGNHQIEIYDSSNRMLKGVLKAAGTGESAVTDVLAGWDFTSGWVLNPNTTIDDNNSFTSTVSLGGILKNGVLVTGGLYKMSLGGSTTGTSIVWRDKESSVNYLTAPSTDKYITALDVGVRLRSTSAGTTDITTLSAFRVTAPSSAGATITTLKNGDVYNWSYKNSSFSFNSASYYVIIKLIR